MDYSEQICPRPWCLITCFNASVHLQIRPPGETFPLCRPWLMHLSGARLISFSCFQCVGCGAEFSTIKAMLPLQKGYGVPYHRVEVHFKHNCHTLCYGVDFLNQFIYFWSSKIYLHCFKSSETKLFNFCINPFLSSFHHLILLKAFYDAVL